MVDGTNKAAADGMDGRKRAAAAAAAAKKGKQDELDNLKKEVEMVSCIEGEEPQWRLQRDGTGHLSGGFKCGRPPPIASLFTKKAAFFRVKVSQIVVCIRDK